MLRIRARILSPGQTLDQMLAAWPFQAYGGQWGKGFMNAAHWIKLNYSGMLKRRV